MDGGVRSVVVAGVDAGPGSFGPDRQSPNTDGGDEPRHRFGGVKRRTRRGRGGGQPHGDDRGDRENDARRTEACGQSAGGVQRIDRNSVRLRPDEPDHLARAQALAETGNHGIEPHPRTADGCDERFGTAAQGVEQRLDGSSVEIGQFAREATPNLEVEPTERFRRRARRHRGRSRVGSVLIGRDPSIDEGIPVRVGARSDETTVAAPHRDDAR